MTQPLHQSPLGWHILPFDDCVLKDGVERKPSVQQNEYKPTGRFPVIDQGSSLIAGYTDDERLVHRDDLPILLFSDHARIFKFLDFPFATGADGTKLLRANEQIIDPRLTCKTDTSTFRRSKLFAFVRQSFNDTPSKLAMFY